MTVGVTAVLTVIVLNTMMLSVVIAGATAFRRVKVCNEVIVAEGDQNVHRRRE